VVTCLPADAPSKGGSEATVRVAKTDLVPTDANLLLAYADWAALESACETFCTEVNTRAHRVTRRAPTEMLAEEQSRLHRLPEHAYTSAFGETRTVGCPQPMVQRRSPPTNVHVAAAKSPQSPSSAHAKQRRP